MRTGFDGGLKVVLAVLGTAVFVRAAVAAPAPAAEFQRRDQWLQQRLVQPQPSPNGSGLAFSFVIDGQPSSQFLHGLKCVAATATLPRGRTQHTLTWSDARTGLEVRCVAVTYADFPAVEWTVSLRNAGQQPTPMLEKILAIDAPIERAEGGEFVLHGQKGDTCAPDLYEPFAETLAAGSHRTFAPNGGRGSNGAFPYYNLQQPGGGMFLAVGWPGQWAATYDRDAARGLHIAAGQQQTHLVLRPGEEIRTPLIALLFWQGDDLVQAQNLWRRWMIAQNLPRTADGALPAPIMPGNTSLWFNEMCNANEENQKTFIDRHVAERTGIDYWWMDAGWYPCQGWPQTGTWEPDLKRFPHGLRAISDHARGLGIKTLVWFEPERVAGGTWLAQNHPEWLLSGRLLNLGDPAARRWLTDHVDRVLSEQGVDLYRQDFNMDPLDCWRRNDPPDRQGLTENLHVQGYLAYWDALRQRHPRLVIDSCASGGRRNDLETMRRAVPLHPTDFNYSQLTVKQAFHHSLFHWIPYFGSNTMPVNKIDAYGIRSGRALSVVLGYDMRRKDLDYELLCKLAAECRHVAPLYYGDFYPLTPYNRDDAQWIAWQFYRPEQGDGVVEAFRRPQSAEAERRFRLAGLDPAAEYDVTDLDAPTPRRLTGRQLLGDGLPLTIKAKPGAATILYQKVGATLAPAAARQQ